MFPSTFSLSPCLRFPRREYTAGIRNSTSPGMSFTNFKVSDKKISEIFRQEDLHVPSFYITTANTTVLFQFLPLSSEWYLFSFFPIFSKLCFKKISILWHIVILDIFLHRFPKTALKNTQNSPLYSILKLTFPKIFKNESFHFSQCSQNFFSNLCLGSSDRLTNY